jgi:thiol-disulfide isomerase/thioredoxin
MIKLKKAISVVASIAAVLAAGGYVMYVMNPAPTVPTISAEAATSGKPYVVKIHAQWCAICMATKDVWSQIQDAYSSRVNLLVLDVTNRATTDASRTEAKRLGLEQFFDEYSGGTGTVLILNGLTKTVTASIDGSRDFAEYRAAIDAALKGESR